MPNPSVFATRHIPEAGLQMIREVAELDVWAEELPPPYETIKERAAECEGILSLLTDRMDGELMDACPRLKVISNYAVGFDNIDVDAATSRGILATNTPEVLSETTADFAFALMLAAARRVDEGTHYVEAGQWKTWGPELLLGQDVHHATLGLVGLGRIGTGVAKRARGFSMRVLYYDAVRRPDIESVLDIEYADMHSLLQQADFVSLHVPLLPGTHHLMGARQFKMMKNTAVLVNTARGPIVDTDALVDALRVGEIMGAGLDVTDPEPLPADHPLVQLPNCLVVPHLASASVQTRTKMATMAAENLIAGLEGRMPPSPVNPQVVGAKNG